MQVAEQHRIKYINKSDQYSAHERILFIGLPGCPYASSPSNAKLKLV